MKKFCVRFWNRIRRHLLASGVVWSHLDAMLLHKGFFSLFGRLTLCFLRLQMQGGDRAGLLFYQTALLGEQSPDLFLCQHPLITSLAPLEQKEVRAEVVNKGLKWRVNDEFHL